MQSVADSEKPPQRLDIYFSENALFLDDYLEYYDFFVYKFSHLSAKMRKFKVTATFLQHSSYNLRQKAVVILINLM
ncbi:MAG: hypothetical protein DYG89_38630 [Caldilinea sp. CFX5]|nr:hypothetical protein [Caldilinea sp. CFX5]